jgi:hypothetical protein
MAGRETMPPMKTVVASSIRFVGLVSLLGIIGCGGSSGEGKSDGSVAGSQGAAGGVGAGGRGGAAGADASVPDGGGAADGGAIADAISTTDAPGDARSDVAADATSDAGDAAATPFPAPHEAAPQVLSDGGHVAANPIIVPIFFSNDDPSLVSMIEDFESKVGASSYWQAATKEYGVGAATTTAPVMLTETTAKTIDDTAIRSWLAQKITSADPAFPSPTDDTIYVIHYPAMTTVTMGTSQTCQGLLPAYHSDLTVPSHKIAYAVVPRCAGYYGLVGIDAATALESGELVAAATDPFPVDDPAFAKLDDAHLYWGPSLGGGSEVGDMCVKNYGSAGKVPDFAYAVQRTWSNAAAAAGQEPCVPVPAGEVYFNAVPVLDDDVPYPGSATVKMKGVTIAVGASKTIDVQLFSDAATSGPWFVDATDGSELLGGPSYLALTLDHAKGINGDTLKLTITVTSAPPSHYETFVLYSSAASNQSDDYLWVGVVGN